MNHRSLRCALLVLWPLAAAAGTADPDAVNRIGTGDPGRGTRKAAYRAYAKMTELLRLCEGGRPARLRTEDGVVAYRFRFPGEERGVLAVRLDH